MKTFTKFLIEQSIEDSYAPIIKMMGTLGIDRVNLPQFKNNDESEDFIKYIKSTGTRVYKGSSRLSDLKPTQKELDMPYVTHLMNNGDMDLMTRPIIITRDSYILDGHHRWAAMLYRGDVQNISIRKINMKMENLLKRKLPYDPGYIPPSVDGSLQSEPIVENTIRRIIGENN